MNEHYSDLQVIPEEQYPKYSNTTTQPEALRKHADPHSDKLQAWDENEAQRKFEKQQQQRRVCGLTAKTFWISVAVVTAVVIAAIVGGAVGGGLASRKQDSGHSDSISTVAASNTPITSSSTLTPSTTTTSTKLISTFTRIAPSATLTVDCPSSNDTLYTPPSSSQKFRKSCGQSFENDGSGVDAISTPATSLDDCINLCAAYNVEQASQIAIGASKICNTVCWRATVEGDDWPGVCFGFTARNVSGSFQYGYDARCDSAALTN